MKHCIAIKLWYLSKAFHMPLACCSQSTLASLRQKAQTKGTACVCRSVSAAISAKKINEMSSFHDEEDLFHLLHKGDLVSSL